MKTPGEDLFVKAVKTLWDCCEPCQDKGRMGKWHTLKVLQRLLNNVLSQGQWCSRVTSWGIKANWQTKDTFSCALSPRLPPLTLLFPRRGSLLWGERAIKCQTCREDVGKARRGRVIALIMAGTRAASVEFCPGTPHTRSYRHPPYPKENSGRILDDSLYLCLSPIRFCFLPVWLSG